LQRQKRSKDLIGYSKQINYRNSFFQMTNFIPIFPLSIVVYPNEELNLHIFEPKYKQLIHECFEQKKFFGMPVVVNNKLQELGTLLEIMEITKTYKTGEMDIKTRGKKVFRILEVIESVPEKLYSGAIVNYPHNHEYGKRLLMNKVIAATKQLHKILNVKNPSHKNEEEIWSYDLAHSVGLTLEEEYELLSLMNELQRQEYLKRHLAKVIPVVLEMEALKHKIKSNGHFKNISGFKLS
jgi:Lon protease-like protein